MGKCPPDRFFFRFAMIVSYVVAGFDAVPFAAGETGPAAVAVTAATGTPAACDAATAA